MITLLSSVALAQSNFSSGPTTTDFKACASQLYKPLWIYHTGNGNTDDVFIPFALKGDGHKESRFFKKGEEAFLFFDGKTAKLFKSDNPVMLGREREYRFVISPDSPPPFQTTAIRISNESNRPVDQSGGGLDVAAIAKSQAILKLSERDLAELFVNAFTDSELKRIDAY